MSLMANFYLGIGTYYMYAFDLESDAAAAQCPQYCDDASDCTPECPCCYKDFSLDKVCNPKPLAVLTEGSVEEDPQY